MAASSRFYMHIHNMSQQGLVAFLEATFADGPRHQEVWTSTITITWSWNGMGAGQAYTACDRSKQAARDTASRMAIQAMGVNTDNLP
ncbi:hypothetical protein FRB94_000778 [Tulasnella sp. JGI-2019a]|nr:hypothetical protein FRB93_002671 [Tulasnella sp. JGI-2019a]KAG9013798.1 hypothetical protein FRB94_000778 [Tulasnella sp. JGI-2019a]KAG9038827.1 hypothetical protein FRB95_014376 [Tulasnella sp. JGI-2019a]